jgi:hypothetical protein
LLLTTKRKQTAKLLLKTRRPLNVIHGSARFPKFNRARDNSPGNGDPPYVAPGPAYGAPGGPGYGPPGPAYGAPAYYGAPGPAYAPPPVHIEREPVYPSAYAAEYVPRPPAAIPYNGGGRCVVNLGYGRWAYCN